MRIFIYAVTILTVIGCASANQATDTGFTSGAFGLTAAQVLPQLAQISQAPHAAQGLNPQQITQGQPFIVQFATSGCSSCKADSQVFAQSGIPVVIVLGDQAQNLNEPLLRDFNSYVTSSQGRMGLFLDNGQAVNTALTRKQRQGVWANHLMVACNRSGNCKLLTADAQSAQQQYGVPAEAANAQAILQFVNSQ